MALHKLSVGLYLPSSISPIVCLDTPTRLASSSCDKSCSALAIFSLMFFISVTIFIQILKPSGHGFVALFLHDRVTDNHHHNQKRYIYHDRYKEDEEKIKKTIRHPVRSEERRVGKESWPRQ